MDLSYDGNGMLVGYTQNDTYSDWAGAQFTNVYSREMTRDGDRILSEKVTSIDGSLLTNDVKTVNYAYDERGASGMRVNGKNYYFVRNLFGDVTAIYDTSGVKKAEYSYDAWGTCYTTLDTDGLGSLNPFRYRGYYYISRIGLYYLTTRFYDYMTGRFVNADVPSICIDDGLTVPEGCNLYSYCLNNPVMCVDPTGHFPILTAILCGIALAGMGLTIGGVASGNNTLTAIGLTMVAIPALISGGMAIAAGIGGATLTGIVGGITTIAGIGTGMFASAEYQEAITGNNWMLDAGMSEGWYNGLMLTTAAIATIGTLMSSFCSSFNLKSVDKIGRMKPSNHPNEGYWGIRFKNSRGALRSFELQNHAPHGFHYQLNSWNPKHMSVKTIRRWTWFLTKM